MDKMLEERNIARRVTLIGAIWDAILGLAKILAGYLSQSQALIADGIHSLSDLVTDVFVYFAANNARQGPDENHPYGHLRFETLTTVFLGIVLVVVAVGIAFNSLMTNSTPEATWYGIGAVLATIVIKEAIFHYTRRAGEKIASKMLIANAWHSRSDALSSIAVLIGLAGVYVGWTWADRVASIVVALLIGKIAIQMIWENIAELVDTAPDKKILNQIKNTVKQLNNVMQPHDLRARSMAGKVYLDMHIQVPSYISVSEGHYLSDAVIRKIKSQHSIVQDVLIHIDPEGIPSTNNQPTHARLPARTQIIADLTYLLRTQADYVSIHSTELHYLQQGLEVDIFAHASRVPQGADLTKVNASLLQDLTGLGYCHKTKVFWHFDS